MSFGWSRNIEERVLEALCYARQSELPKNDHTEFYAKHGYALVGKLHGVPRNSSRQWFSKVLNYDEPAHEKTHSCHAARLSAFRRGAISDQASARGRRLRNRRHHRRDGADHRSRAVSVAQTDGRYRQQARRRRNRRRPG